MSNRAMFMTNNNLTLRSLSQKSGISKSTLGYQLHNPVKYMRYGTLHSIAKVVHTSTDQVAHELSHGGWHLNIDDNNHTIQGVYIGNTKQYLVTKDVVLDEYYEGWQPNSTDIKNLVNSRKHPSDKLKHIMSQYVSEAKEKGVYLGK